LKSEFILNVEGIKKSFGKVEALKGVNLELNPNEILGLIGDNGAGKSTLIKIITGLLKPDEGKIYYKGKEVHFKSPLDAREVGIEAVSQNGSLVGIMNIARNYSLAIEPTRKMGPFQLLDMKKMVKMCNEGVGKIGIKLRSPFEAVSVLSGGERQAISIARAISTGSKCLLLDEPMAGLGVKEQRQVTKLIKEVRFKNEVSIIYISHNLHHIYPVADRFIMLDNGIKIFDIKKKETTEEELGDLMANEEYKLNRIKSMKRLSNSK